MPDAIAQTSPTAPAAVSPLYRGYALYLLLVVYILNGLDRQVVSILAEPIKHDLHLADWQIGVMSGFAFILFYSVLGLPIARMAEHRSRPIIITWSLVVWCGFTALCGAAQSFLQLCLFRIGVGVGEAGCSPTAQALISDYFPKTQRASALSTYAMGAPLGVLAGLAFGGLVADAYGWRIAFLLAGAPGLFVAGLVALSLREPRSKNASDQALLKAAQPSVGAALRLLASKKTFWLLAGAAGLKLFFTDGQAGFAASFFRRSHGAQIEQLASLIGMKPMGFLGLVLGLINGVFGSASAMLGGLIADRANARDVRDIVILPILGIVVTVPAFVAAMMTDDLIAALAFYAVLPFTNVFWAGPVYATTHGIVPQNMRATATSILLFILIVMGTGLGQAFIGALSDVFAGPLGMGEARGLRNAMIAAAFASLVGVGLFWLARKTIVNDLEPG